MDGYLPIIYVRGYEDFFVRVDEQGRVEELEHTCNYPLRSLWIYRYYDQTSSHAGEGDRKIGRLVTLVFRIRREQRR